MDLSTITVSDFKARFYRDFYYKNQVPDPELPPPVSGVPIIQDLDITNAFADAKLLLNQALFNSNDGITTGYLLLTAHCLCLNIRASFGGAMSGASGAFAVQSKSAGNVSESYAIPEAYMDNPIFMQYTQTLYGNRYLQLILPKMVGNVVAVFGGALP